MIPLSFRIVVAGAAVLGLFACADALRLELPVGSGGGDAGTTVGIGGGGGVIGCASNSDCPEPTSVCDDIKGICVECLDLEDCAFRPGTVCDAGVCACPGDETFCPSAGCVDTMASPEHCGTCDRACFGACSAGACVDPWIPVGDDGAPVARGFHVAAFAAGKMMIWGGSTTTNTSNNLDDGGLYDPATNTWTKITSVGAPSARQAATAVWTGTEVIVWGGRDGGVFLNDGAIFDPATNTWRSMTTGGAPPGRFRHTAVWSGSQMVVFGGQDGSGRLADGGRYDPATDTWSPTQAVPPPGETRANHTAVWDDGANEMIVFGGLGDYAAMGAVFFPDGTVPGGRSYNPALNTWDTVTTTSQATARDRHTAVFSDGRMLVFGGYNGTSEIDLGYKLENGTWSTFNGDAPRARREHTAVVLEDTAKMVIFGGRNSENGTVNLADGGVYDLATNAWEKPVPTAIGGRFGHTAVSTGGTMIVWGGFDTVGALATGGIYTP